MASPAFTSHPDIKIKALREAARHLKQAEMLLRRGANNSANWAEHDTFIHFADETAKVLSDDNGECGMTPWAKEEYNICI